MMDGAALLRLWHLRAELHYNFPQARLVPAWCITVDDHVALHVHRRIAITTRATAIDPGGSGARRDVTDSQQNVGVEAVVAGGDAEGQVAIPAGGIEVKPPEWLQREVVA